MSHVLSVQQIKMFAFVQLKLNNKDIIDNKEILLYGKVKKNVYAK